jgi:CelD/BcsL family acetyltransferase involved in cellulose biosynthesis
MRIVFSEDGQDFHRRGWYELVQADPAGTFFHTPAFLKLYWEEFGETPDHLLLAFAEEDDGTQVGAVALERIGDTLRFLGGTEVTDYMGPVGVPERQDAMAKELWTALLTREDWREADLRGLPEDQSWFGLLRDAASAQGLAVTEDDDGVSPFLPLPASWDDYLAGLSSKHRHEIKRKGRKLAEEAGEFRIVTADDETLTPLLDRFVELHRMSEGPKGVFMVPGMEIFFRRLGEAFCAQGVFRLTFIEVGGQLAAGTIGFVWGGTSYLYNSAFDRSWGTLAPGMVLVGEDIRLAIEEGCEGFDLLKGDYEYKYRFGSSARAVKRLVVTR